MPATLMPQNSNRSAQTGTDNAQQGKVPQAFIPFTRGAKEHTEPGQTFTATLSANTQQQSHKVPVFGYIHTLYLVVTAVTAGNAANVAFNADAPWNVIRNLNFRDANGIPIRNLSGYQNYLAEKWGGYWLFRPDQDTFAFSQTTGAVATGGSFTFVMPISCAFGRDGLGALPNMDASSQYAIDLTLGTLTDVYSTAPTAAPTITTQLFLRAYQNPPASDLAGNSLRNRPPALGTVQYWSNANFNINAAENVLYLPRVGNLIRNHILVWRDVSGVRQNTMVPSGNVRTEMDSTIMFNESMLLRRQIGYQTYGYSFDTGTIVYGRTDDPDRIPSGEYGDKWLATLGSTKLALIFTPGAAGTLEVLTNDIYPEGNIWSVEQ